MAQISFRSSINLWEMRLIIWFKSLLTAHNGPTGRSYELFSIDVVAHHLILWITVVYCPTIKINTRRNYGYPLAVRHALHQHLYTMKWTFVNISRVWTQRGLMDVCGAPCYYCLGWYHWTSCLWTKWPLRQQELGHIGECSNYNLHWVCIGLVVWLLDCVVGPHPIWTHGPLQ